MYDCNLIDDSSKLWRGILMPAVWQPRLVRSTTYCYGVFCTGDATTVSVCVCAGCLATPFDTLDVQHTVNWCRLCGNPVRHPWCPTYRQLVPAVWQPRSTPLMSNIPSIGAGCVATPFDTLDVQHTVNWCRLCGNPVRHPWCPTYRQLVPAVWQPRSTPLMSNIPSIGAGCVATPFDTLDVQHTINWCRLCGNPVRHPWCPTYRQLVPAVWQPRSTPLMSNIPSIGAGCVATPFDTLDVQHTVNWCRLCGNPVRHPWCPTYRQLVPAVWQPRSTPLMSNIPSIGAGCVATPFDTLDVQHTVNWCRLCGNPVRYAPLHIVMECSVLVMHDFYCTQFYTALLWFLNGCNFGTRVFLLCFIINSHVLVCVLFDFMLNYHYHVWL